MRNFTYRVFKIEEAERLSNTSYWKLSKINGGKVYMPNGDALDVEMISARNEEDVMDYINRIHY